jgi:hypothetical protein
MAIIIIIICNNKIMVMDNINSNENENNANISNGNINNMCVDNRKYGNGLKKMKMIM